MLFSPPARRPMAVVMPTIGRTMLRDSSPGENGRRQSAAAMPPDSSVVRRSLLASAWMRGKRNADSVARRRP